MNVPRPSGVWAIPSLTISSVALPSMRCPSKRTLPLVFTMPHTARSVVVLPAPLAPRIAVMPPASTAKPKPWRTLVAPYCASRFSASSSVGTSSRLPSQFLASPSQFLASPSQFLASKVGLDHVGVALDLGGRALGDLPAEVEHDHPVRHLHHEAHVVLDQ